MEEPLITPSIDLKGRRILAVDDDRINLRIIGGILRHEGYEILEADSGEAALEAYATFLPNLVLLGHRRLHHLPDAEEDLQRQVRAGDLRHGEERGRRCGHGL
jgi:DNA-binding response OmpR family regulator